MTPKERDAIQRALASTSELLDDVASTLNTVCAAAALLGKGLERVREDLATISRLVGGNGETPESRCEDRPN